MLSSIERNVLLGSIWRRGGIQLPAFRLCGAFTLGFWGMTFGFVDYVLFSLLGIDAHISGLLWQHKFAWQIWRSIGLCSLSTFSGSAVRQSSSCGLYQSFFHIAGQLSNPILRACRANYLNFANARCLCRILCILSRFLLTASIYAGCRYLSKMCRG